MPEEALGVNQQSPPLVFDTIQPRFIALSPGPLPRLAVLRTEKQAFQCAALQSWPGDMATV